jgi:hypothetical protein
MDWDWDAGLVLVNLAAKSCFIAHREMLPESFRTSRALGGRKEALAGLPFL